MTGELAKDGGNIKALWSRLKKSDLQTTVWCGTSAYVFAPTGPGAGDYIQIALGRESEFRDGPIVNRESRPRRQEELLDPIWRGWDQPREEDRLVGPIYCLVNRRGGDVVHMGSFLERCGGANAIGRRLARRCSASGSTKPLGDQSRSRHSKMCK